MWADVDLVLGIGSRIEFRCCNGVATGEPDQINTDADELDRHGIGARHPRRRAEVCRCCSTAGE
jgi:hypothetical protein